MATLDDICNVQIELQTTGVARANFGTPMIVAPLMTFTERVRTYSSYNEADEDDLPPAVKTALSDCFGQTPRPRTVKVGRRQVSKAVVTVAEITNLGTYSITAGTDTYSYTADGTATAAEIVAGLAAAILADTNEKITGTVVGDTLEIAYISQSDLVPVVLATTNLAWGTITPSAAGGAVGTDLSAILDEDAAWYCLVMTDRVKQTQLDAAEWTEANEKLFLTATAEAAVLTPGDSTDLISVLKNTRYFRTAAIYHANAATEYPDAAWAGRVLTLQPGSETWALKQLASITPSNLTSTNRTTIYGKGGNTFEFIEGQNIALIGVGVTGSGGKTAAGEWIDVIRFRDWLKNVIQTNMVQMMINRPKIPYTDPGIQMCVSNLRKSLKEGVDVGGIAPDELDAAGNTVPGFVITYPRSVELSPVIKASRVLSLSFTARLAGAIHLVEVNGALAYEL